MRVRGLIAVFVCVGLLGAASDAWAEACPADLVDGGAWDDGPGADGLVTMSTDRTTAASADTAGFDCTGRRLLVTAGTTFTLLSDPTTLGMVAKFRLDELLIEPGAFVQSSVGCAGGNNANGEGVTDSGLICGVGDGNGVSADPATGGAHGGISGTNTIRYGTSTTTNLWGAGGGGHGGAGNIGGAGGGVVFIELINGSGGNTIGRLINNGVIRANGGDGTLSGGRAGGGAGGTVVVVGTTVQGTGTFQANGGDAVGDNASGGGGGRIRLEHDLGDDFVAADFQVAGGAKVGTGSVGGTGTVYVNKGAGTAGVITAFHGFQFNNTAISEATGSFTIDTTAAANLYCAETAAGSPALAAPSIIANDVTLRGTINCPQSTLTSFDITANNALSLQNSFVWDIAAANADLTLTGTGSFTVGTSVTLTFDGLGTNLAIDLPNNATQSWTGLTINGAAANATTASDGILTINEPTVNLVLAGGTKIKANVDFTVNDLAMTGSTDHIDATGLGCAGGVAAGAAAQGPTGANLCTASTTGFGGVTGTGSPGGSHGGQGGAGTGTGGVGTNYGTSYVTTAFWGSGGGAANANQNGGNGGGMVALTIGGTFSHEGQVITDGGPGLGGVEGSGGGSGGTISVDANVISGSSGKFYSRGGIGGNGSGGEGGGGGGGRIYIASVTGGSYFPLVSGDTSVSGGTAQTGAVAGTAGTVLARSGVNPNAAISVFHGFLLDNTAVAQTGGSFTIDTSAGNNIICSAAATTPSITATTVNLAGTIDCTAAALTAFTVHAGTLTLAANTTITMDDASAAFGGGFTWATFTSNAGSFNIGSGTTLNVTGDGALTKFNLANASSQTWSNFDFNGASRGNFVLDAVDATVVLSGGSEIKSNIFWQIKNLTLSSSSDKIQANGFGCSQAGTGANSDGFGPTVANVCTLSDRGHGAGGATPNSTAGATHGGIGGDAGGTLFLLASAGNDTPYGDLKAPAFFGASSGNSGTTEGASGGGLITLEVNGTLTNNGAIEAKGNAGVAAGTGAVGGGAGGAIYLQAAVYAGSAGTLSAAGGNGFNSSVNDSGGGGGGRVSVKVGQDSSSTLASATASSVAGGGTNGGGVGLVGAVGTLHLGRNGLACVINSDCYNNQCVDGYCCTSTCGGGAVDCQACSVALGASTNGTCAPANAGLVCKGSSGPCDPAETCTGSSTTCPADVLAANGTVCNDDGLVCNGGSTCQNASCTPGLAPDCDDSNDCTIDVCGEPDGCAQTNKPNGTACGSGGLCATGVCDLPDASVDGSVDSSVDTVPPPDSTLDLPPADTSIDAPVIVPDTSVDTLVIVAPDTSIDTTIVSADSSVDSSPTGDSSVDGTAIIPDTTLPADVGAEGLSDTLAIDTLASDTVGGDLKASDADMPDVDGATTDIGGTGGTGGEPEGGCAGCSVQGGNSPASDLLLFGLLMLGWVVRRRRV